MNLTVEVEEQKQHNKAYVQEQWLQTQNLTQFQANLSVHKEERKQDYQRKALEQSPKAVITKQAKGPKLIQP